MKPLCALISKNNIKNASVGLSFLVWPVDDDFTYVVSNPHWIEIKMSDTEKFTCGYCYVFDEKQLLKDINFLNSPKTRIYISHLSQDKLIEKLKDYQIKPGSSYTVELSHENWLETYTVNEFKKLYK